MAGDPDVIVIGAGPNGLTAAAILAGAGLEVLVLETADEVGGAVRTREASLPGYRHDVLSGFYPLARVGPISRLPLDRFGLEWCAIDRPYGGAAPGGAGFAVERDPYQTRRAMASADRPGWDELWWTWRQLGEPFLDVLFHPLGSIPPLLRLGGRLLSRRGIFEFARLALAPARTVAEESFVSEDARIWFVGSALHSDLAPEAAGSSLYSLVLMGLAQQVGMPVPRGGAQALADALRACVESRGGRVRTGERVERVLVRNRRAAGVATASGEIAARRAVLATVEPQRLFLRLLGDGALPERFLRAVRRYRWGTGTFKLDCALSGLPTFAADRLNGVGVVHLGESIDALSMATAEAAAGLLPSHPFLIAGFHTLADPTRAPAGGHTLWIETHVPARIRGDARGEIQAADWESARAPFAERILKELERYAPGARALVRGLHAQSPGDLEAADANLVGGDISGGSFALHQQLVLRPVPGWFRHRTPVRGLYMGGASTHPGGGVHGAPGANAARVLLGDLGLARRYNAALR